jgi:hypothetical protein
VISLLGDKSIPGTGVKCSPRIDSSITLYFGEFVIQLIIAKCAKKFKNETELAEHEHSTHIFCLDFVFHGMLLNTMFPRLYRGPKSITFKCRRRALDSWRSLVFVLVIP